MIRMLMNSETGAGPNGVWVSSANSSPVIERSAVTRCPVSSRNSSRTCRPVQDLRQSTNTSLLNPPSLLTWPVSPGVWPGAGLPSIRDSAPPRWATWSCTVQPGQSVGVFHSGSLSEEHRPSIERQTCAIISTSCRLVVKNVLPLRAAGSPWFLWPGSLPPGPCVRWGPTRTSLPTPPRPRPSRNSDGWMYPPRSSDHHTPIRSPSSLVAPYATGKLRPLSFTSWACSRLSALTAMMVSPSSSNPALASSQAANCRRQ